MAPKIDIGSTIAAYKITELIADDGMGIVYRGEHETTGAIVAVKVLSPSLAGDKAARERFLREARYTSALSHPNIMKVFDAGESKKVLYIAMQFVRGQDLKQLLADEGPLQPGRAVELLSQVAMALDAAHAAGIVHRDVKPSNVLIASGEGGEPAGHVYLTDFGLGRRSNEDDALTQPGTFVGNALYSAPEQVSGGDIDQRADVYALGCMLFECLVGELPYVHERAVDVMRDHISAPPPTISDRREGLPVELDEVIATAMAKDPHHRYQTCDAVTDSARAALESAGMPVSPAPAEVPVTPEPSLPVPPSGEVELAPPTPPPVVVGPLVLMVSAGPAEGMHIEVDAELVIGRELRGEASLGDDPQISRRHARVWRSEGVGYLIEDLGSSNGTRLNGQPVTPGAPFGVTMGDTIELGTSVLLVSEVGVEQPAPIAIAAPARFAITLEVDLDAQQMTVRLGDDARVISLVQEGAHWQEPHAAAQPADEVG